MSSENNKTKKYYSYRYYTDSKLSSVSFLDPLVAVFIDPLIVVVPLVDRVRYKTSKDLVQEVMGGFYLDSQFFR